MSLHRLPYYAVVIALLAGVGSAPSRAASDSPAALQEAGTQPEIVRVEPAGGAARD